MKGWPIRGDWHDWRPAIWLTMIGIAVMLLFSPFFLGALFIGAAIGVAIRISQRRRRLAAAARSPGSAGRGSRGRGGRRAGRR
jgi:hypothetical protein